MSLSIDGVWKTGVWATTVWADGVWREGAYTPVVLQSGGSANGGKRRNIRFVPDGFKIPEKIKEIILEVAETESKSPITDLKVELTLQDIDYENAYGQYLSALLKQEIDIKKDEFNTVLAANSRELQAVEDRMEFQRKEKAKMIAFLLLLD